MGPHATRASSFYERQSTMYLKLALFAMAALISGCASVNTVVPTKADLARLQGQTLAVKTGEPSSFVLSTPENNRSFMRAATMTREGNEIVANSRVPDPAQAIAVGVAQRLEKAYGSQTSLGSAPAKWTLEVKTTNWGLFFTDSDKTKYGVVYSATFRLIDTQRGAVVASFYCVPRKVHATIAERGVFLDQSAQGLKNALSQVSEECVKTITNEVLSMP